MKKGFISITIIYSFLLIFIFTLLTLLVLYTRKSRLVDSISNEAKEQLYITTTEETNYETIHFTYDSTAQTGQQLEIDRDGYYFIEAYSAEDSNEKATYASGYIYLTRNDYILIYVGGASDSDKSTDVRYFSTMDNTTDILRNSSESRRARILYAGSGYANSFISGYAGMNAVLSSSSDNIGYITKHYSGKYFLDGKITENVTILKNNQATNGKVDITYIGKSLSKKNTSLSNVRYIKDCINGNSTNVNNHWTEIQAIKDGENIALNKAVTGTSPQNNGSTHSYSNMVDGQINNITTSSGWGRSTSSGNQCVTIDLGTTYNLDEIAVWHYYLDKRSYYKNVTYVSATNENNSWTTVLNESSIETSQGKRISAYSDPTNGYITRGLVVWYDGNVHTSPWKNLFTSGTYNGIVSGTTRGNNYLSFNGTSSYVRVGNLNNSNFTIEAVIMSDENTNDEQYILSNFEDGGYTLSIDDEYKFNASIYANTANEVKTVKTPTEIVANKIYSVTATYDENELQLYTLGNLKSYLPLNDSIKEPTNNTNLIIGADPLGNFPQTINPHYFKGKVYSVRIYNSALTEDEIYHNYLVDKRSFGLE